MKHLSEARSMARVLGVIKYDCTGNRTVYKNILGTAGILRVHWHSIQTLLVHACLIYEIYVVEHPTNNPENSGTLILDLLPG